MTREEEENLRALAARMFDAVAHDDMREVADCYDEDVIIWHNFDDTEQSGAENLAALATLPKRISDRSYEDKRVEVFDGGFVQQHVLHGTRVGDNKRLTMAGIIICRVKNGKVIRLDEYLDSKDVAEFRKVF